MLLLTELISHLIIFVHYKDLSIQRMVLLEAAVHVCPNGVEKKKKTRVGIHIQRSYSRQLPIALTIEYIYLYTFERVDLSISFEHLKVNPLKDKFDVRS